MTTGMKSYGVWIDGHSRPGGADPVDLIDPATGNTFATLAVASTSDLSDGVEAAQRAFENSGWRTRSPLERAEVLNRMATRLRIEADRIGRLETQNVGRPLKQTIRNVELAADAFAYFAAAGASLRGATIPIGPNLFDYTLREPYGVCGVITPWNNPIVLSSWKIAACLAAGNALVVKPATLTPVSILDMARLLEECGLPTGLLNVVPGSGSVLGLELIRHPLVRKISFTGSTEVGKLVMASAANQVKRVSLELGGKSPSIVFADADLEAVADRSIPAMFANAGQMCTARSRILVEDSAYEKFVELLCTRVRSLRLGDPFSDDTDVGPVISKVQLETVSGFVDRARRAGAEIRVGGSRSSVAGREGGFFFQPSVLTQVDDSMEIVQHEVFGPVVVVDRFSAEDEVIRRCNATPYGLAATIWTNDLARAHRLAASLEVGTVSVNLDKITHVYAPFGGYKESGLGRELGIEGLDEFLQVKNVVVALPGVRVDRRAAN